jgi:hypothetical protein
VNRWRARGQHADTGPESCCEQTGRSFKGFRKVGEASSIDRL